MYTCSCYGRFMQPGPGHRTTFQTVKRMLAPDWAQKMLCIITPNLTADSHENVAGKVNTQFFSLYRDYSNSLTLSNASELVWSWISINHIQVYKEKENFVIACLFTSFTKREIGHFHLVVVRWRQINVQKSVMHVQSCCFALSNYSFFCFLVAAAS